MTDMTDQLEADSLMHMAPGTKPAIFGQPRGFDSDLCKEPQI